MEVRLFPNSSRPGVGMKPRREGQRPLLPQHSRHCPVLEAGSAAGFLVYPPLEPTESYHIEYQGEGKYSFAFMVSATPGGKWEGLFSVQITLPVGSIGMLKEEVAFTSRKPPLSREAALSLMRAFIVPEDMGTPPGAISLRAATSFQTPPGWDSVYTPVFNLIDRPIAPMLVIRVETDTHGGTYEAHLKRADGTAAAWPIRKRENNQWVSLAAPDPEILALVKAEHEATLAYVRRPVAKTTDPITSYFALVQDDPSIQVVTRAQTDYVRAQLKDTPYAKLPILSAGAPFKAGGRGGPNYFTDVAAEIGRAHV